MVIESKLEKWTRLLIENEESHQPDLGRFVIQSDIPFRFFSQEMFDVLGEQGKFLYPSMEDEGEADEDEEDYVLIGVNVF